MEAGTQAPNPQPAASHLQIHWNAFSAGLFRLENSVPRRIVWVQPYLPTDTGSLRPSLAPYSSRLVLLTVQNLVDEARLHDQSVVQGHVPTGPFLQIQIADGVQQVAVAHDLRIQAQGCVCINA